MVRGARHGGFHGWGGREALLGVLVMLGAGCLTQAPTPAAPDVASQTWHFSQTLPEPGVLQVHLPVDAPGREPILFEGEFRSTLESTEGEDQFLLAELHWMPTNGPVAQVMGKAVLSSSRDFAVSLEKDGDAVVSRQQLSDGQLGFRVESLHRIKESIIVGPGSGEWLLVVAYASSPLPRTPPRVELVLEAAAAMGDPHAESQPGRAGVFSFDQGDFSGGPGLAAQVGPIVVAQTQGAHVAFDTQERTYFRAAGHLRNLAAADGGAMELRVTNSTGTQAYRTGPDAVGAELRVRYHEAVADHWRFDLDVTGDANLVLAYADLPRIPDAKTG